MSLQTNAVSVSRSEPNWLPLERIYRLKIPPNAAYWLLDQASLTKRLIAVCPQHFKVRLLSQGWGHGLPSEARSLTIRQDDACWVRQVELMCDDQPWVFARTLIPAGSLRGRARLLTGLGMRPLGALLFADPLTRRELFEVARLVPRQPLFERATAHLEPRPEEIWGRRTRFVYANQPLLVNEIFLRDIPEPHDDR